jgi:Flp pilus assembly protein TadB
MSAVGFALASVGLVLLPASGADRRSRETATRAARTRGSRSPLPAVLASGLASVVLLGPVRGLLAAAVLCPAAFAGLAALQRRPVARAPTRAVALALDLCAAALRAGNTTADALEAASPAADADTAEAFVRVAGLLRLGADPPRAWAVVASSRASPLAPVAATAVRSATSGIRAAAAFERLADQIRADCAAAAAARAHRAGILAMAPLAACFLPSFVCLGIVPVVVGIAGSALGVLH